MKLYTGVDEQDRAVIVIESQTRCFFVVVNEEGHSASNNVNHLRTLEPAYFFTAVSEMWVRSMARQLRYGDSMGQKIADELMKQLPPELPEPKGIGAVVRLNGGDTATRVGGGSWYVSSKGFTKLWEDLDVVEILGQGVGVDIR